MGLDAGSKGVEIDPVKLAEAVKAAMEGWTQEALESVSGISQSRISAIRRNYRGERATLDEALRIEQAVGLPYGWILGFAGVVTVEGVRRGAEAANNVIPLPKARRRPLAEAAEGGRTKRASRPQPRPGRAVGPADED